MEKDDEHDDNRARLLLTWEPSYLGNFLLPLIQLVTNLAPVKLNWCQG
jgi:hypothetical protein